MPLLGALQLLVSHLKFTARRVLRHSLGEELPKRRGGRHMSVNIDDFVSVVHRSSFGASQSSELSQEIVSCHLELRREIFLCCSVLNKDFSLRSKRPINLPPVSALGVSGRF